MASGQLEGKREDFCIVFKAKKRNESEAKCNESEVKCNEFRRKLDHIPTEKLSAKARARLLSLFEALKNTDFFNGVMVAEILSVSDQTARHLLRKAEELKLLKSKGSTKDKKYFF